VYRLLSRKGLSANTFPAQETALVEGDLAFRQHAGGHTNAPNWQTFLSFADRYFSGRPLLSSLFDDHAVLQRDQPVRVWGWTTPGDTVTVTLQKAAGAENDPAARDVAASTTPESSAAAVVSATARANQSSGRWIATLPPTKAGGPYTLSVRSETGATVTAKDILLGDVWLCSGQSNMVLQVHRALDSRAEIARATNDSIRMLTLDLIHSSTPQPDVWRPAPWRVTSPSAVPEFSAACYYFARELQRTVNVPMGLINSSWGGSKIQAWMSAEGLRQVPGQNVGLELLSLQIKDPSAALVRWGEQWQSWWRERGGSRISAEPWNASADTSRDWRAAPTKMGAWEEWGIPELAEFNGVVWYRNSFQLDANQARGAATLSLGPIDEVDTTWVNGKAVGYTSGAGTPRSYALPPGTLRAGENTIAVAALDTYATGGMLGTAGQRSLTLEDGTRVPLDSGWRFLPAPPPSSVGMPPRAPWESMGGMTTIYNAMIAPLTPYTLRGVAWYQGESNTDEATEYGDMLKAWMADWRKQFQSAQLPFLIVQLTSYGPAATKPGESGWALLREKQRTVTTNDERSALAVILDIGDRYDVHPANKQEVGRRLARAARHVVYGESIAPSGPAPKSATRAANEVIVQFDDVQGKLTPYGSRHAIGFELCAQAAGSCQFAEGVTESDRVRISVPQGTNVTRVRHCWADSPVCNLYDESGLPAGPFELPVTNPTSSHLPGAQ
jgi:sialate O-acetylesterase